jgi:hypothetical protein
MTEEEEVEYNKIMKKANIAYICILIVLLVLAIITDN